MFSQASAESVPIVGWMRRATLRDGAEILLRLIRPADEQLWIEMLAACSPETIHRRFGCLFQEPSHEMAEHYCNDDYWNEMAIVAIAGEEDNPVMIGVVRLAANEEHESAEFAILVCDKWQGLGVGTLLMDDCLDNCPRWGIERVYAEVAPTNERMLRMFRRRGFELDYSVSADIVIAERSVTHTSARTAHSQTKKPKENSRNNHGPQRASNVCRETTNTMQ